MKRIAVVGAGVVGLSTALNILQHEPQARVTVIADKVLNDTTSSGAGGHFRPNILHMKGVSKEKLKEWALVSRDHFYGLANSSLSEVSGTMFMSGYLLLDEPEENLLGDIVLHFRQLSRQEMDRLNFKQRYGYVYTTTVTEMKKYLVWLTSCIMEKGAILQQKKLSSLSELVGEYDIVVNCCGLGSRDLLGDDKIVPVKGQLVKVRAPWIKTFYTSESNGQSTYVYPHSDIVNLGGSRETGSSNLDADPEVVKDIVRRTKELVPALQGANIVATWVGLRPTRSPLRLEPELLHIEGKDLKVVHNYGHGAMGITLSWGTAVEATTLVRQWINGLQKTSRL